MSAASVVSLRPCQLEIQNIERLHLQQCSIITTQSQQVSSHLHCERKSPPSQITDFHSRRGSATKMTLILTQNMKKNAVRHTHAQCENLHLSSGRLFALHCYQCVHAVCSGVVCLCVFACVCKQYLTHSFHSLDSSGCPSLAERWADRDPPLLDFLQPEMKLEKCLGSQPISFCLHGC